MCGTEDHVATRRPYMSSLLISDEDAKTFVKENTVKQDKDAVLTFLQ